MFAYGSSSGTTALVYSAPTTSTPPVAPSNLQATAIDSGSIRLDWADESDNEEGFEITDAITSAFVGANTQTYTWAGLIPNTYKCFKVRAFNAVGSSDWTPPTAPYYVCATTPMVPPAGDIVMTLITPGGHTVMPSDPGVTFDSGSGFAVYSVTNPEPGQWSIELHGAAVPAGGREVITVVTSIPAPTLPFQKGNVNCDDDVNSVDSLKILRYVAGLPVSQNPGCPEIGGALAAAIEVVAGGVFGDVDCDAAVNAVDALKILRYVAGLPNNLPPDCSAIGSYALSR